MGFAKEGVWVEVVVFQGRKYPRYPDSPKKVHRLYFGRSGHLLHRDVWEHHHGPIPDGHHVHHIDEDPGITMSTTLNVVHRRTSCSPCGRYCGAPAFRGGQTAHGQQYAPQPQSGTEATRGAHGTKTTRSRHLQQPGGPRRSTLLKWRLFAGGVAQKVLEATTRGFFADPAVKRPNRGTGSVSAVRCTHTMQPVYNLTVAGAECYYANDVLVHNCVQAMMRIRQGGFVRLDSDEKYDENDADYRQPVNYY